jgi:hypothetical protein
VSLVSDIDCTARLDGGTLSYAVSEQQSRKTGAPEFSATGRPHLVQNVIHFFFYLQYIIDFF